LGESISLVGFIWLRSGLYITYIKKVYISLSLTHSKRGIIMRTEISTLFGLNVYTDKGVYIGKVNDVILDPNESKITGLAVRKINDKLFNVEGNKGIILPYRWVIAVADVILIKQMVLRLKKSEEEEEKESD